MRHVIYANDMEPLTVIEHPNWRSPFMEAWLCCFTSVKCHYATTNSTGSTRSRFEVSLIAC